MSTGNGNYIHNHYTMTCGNDQLCRQSILHNRRHSNGNPYGYSRWNLQCFTCRIKHQCIKWRCNLSYQHTWYLHGYLYHTSLRRMSTGNRNNFYNRNSSQCSYHQLYRFAILYYGNQCTCNKDRYSRRNLQCLTCRIDH